MPKRPLKPFAYPSHHHLLRSRRCDWQHVQRTGTERERRQPSEDNVPCPGTDASTLATHER